TDLAVRAVAQRERRERDLDVLERIAVGAARRRVLEALHRALPDRVGDRRHRGERALEVHAAAARPAAHPARRLAVDRLLLAGGRGRAFEHRVALALAEHRLAIHDLRLARARLHAVLAPHAVDDDLEVELAHAVDQGLTGIGVLLDAERRVLLGHLA